MENLSILAAAAESQGQSEISAEPVGQEGHAITAVDSNTPGQTKAPSPMSQPFLWVIFALIAVMMFTMLREPKRRQKQQQKMIQSLKKNDKVRTIGGIIGTVVDIKGDEIILKVDEANNTKIRIVASAIGKTLESEGQ
jgi:preprotein translocase subunit YajC